MFHAHSDECEESNYVKISQLSTYFSATTMVSYFEDENPKVTIRLLKSFNASLIHQLFFSKCFGCSMELA